MRIVLLLCFTSLSFCLWATTTPFAPAEQDDYFNYDPLEDYLCMETPRPLSTPDGAFVMVWEVPRNGVVHLNLVGNYRINWDWEAITTATTSASDFTAESGDVSHTYARSDAGTNKTIVIIDATCNCTEFTGSTTDKLERFISATDAPYYPLLLKMIVQWGNIEWTSMANAFSYISSFFNIIASDSPNLTGVEDMTAMFKNSKGGLWNISDWNTGSVTTMDSMFYSAQYFTADISGWDVSNVTDMNSMFFDATRFNQDISGWGVSNVTDMSYMFSTATSFNQYIGDWNVSSVTDMRYMFANADAFNQDIGNWDVSSVMFMDGMFDTATSFNQDIGNWDVSEVVRMKSMFSGATSFNQDIGNWDVSNVYEMSNMLDNCGMTRYHYEQTLNAWVGKIVRTNVKLGTDGLKFCDASGRSALIGSYIWTISEDTRVCYESGDNQSVLTVSESGIYHSNASHLRAGCLAQGTTQTYTFTIENKGYSQLNINEVTIAWGNATSTPVNLNPPSTVNNLVLSPRIAAAGETSGETPANDTSPGGTATFEVTVPTGTEGDIEGVITIQSNDPDYPAPNHYQIKISAYVSSAPTTLYVDENATGNNRGRDWGNAYTDLQAALSAARRLRNQCVEIQVAEGTYKPGVYIATNNDPQRRRSFQLLPGVAIKGGYPTGGELVI